LYYEEIGEDWLYEYGRGINRLTNRQLRAILGREPASQQRAATGAWSFNWQILFLSIPLLAVLLIAIRAIRRYDILLLAALRPDRSSAVKIVAKIAASFHRRGVDRPDRLGWVRWAERISAATPQLAPRLQTRSRRLLTVIQRLMYSDRPFRKRDLRLIRTFYLNYCAGSVISR
jgi:hypothetical protein